MAEWVNGMERPDTSQTRNDVDWSGQAIAGQIHDNVLFIDLDMTEVENTASEFNECTFRNGRFNASRHSDAAFVNCTFKNCNFFGARFVDCKFVGSVFVSCNFDNFSVSGGNWSFVGLGGARLERAEIEDVRLREADLTRARMAGSKVTGSDLSGASLDEADLRGCDLRRSTLNALSPQRTLLEGAIITIDQTIMIAEGLGLDVRLE